MKCPKIHCAKAVNHHVLAIEFNNGETKLCDVSPLLKNVQVETGGYAVFWNEEIDISEYELWIHGTNQ